MDDDSVAIMLLEREFMVNRRFFLSLDRIVELDDCICCLVWFDRLIDLL